jgi:transposase
VLQCARTRPSPELRQKDQGEGRSYTDTLTVSSRTTPRNKNTSKTSPLSPGDAALPRHAHRQRRGTAGRHWLSRQDLPADERAAVQALVRQLDFHAGELTAVTKELAAEAPGDPVVARLMTIPCVDALTAISVVAAVGDFTRFDSPGKLVSYLGLNPKVRQSGKSAPAHSHISKAGRSQVRGVMVEAAWSAARSPGRCAPSTSASMRGAATRPQSWPLPGS